MTLGKKVEETKIFIAKQIPHQTSSCKKQDANNYAACGDIEIEQIIVFTNSTL